MADNHFENGRGCGVRLMDESVRARSYPNNLPQSNLDIERPRPRPEPRQQRCNCANCCKLFWIILACIVFSPLIIAIGIVALAVYIVLGILALAGIIVLYLACKIYSVIHLIWD